MRICYLTSYYPPYIKELLKKYDEFKGYDYQKSLDLVLSELYADTGSIYHYSKLAGNDAHIIIQNFEIIQKKWALENGFVVNIENWEEEIALAQIKKMRLDVFYSESIDAHSSTFFTKVKEMVKKVVVWISFPFEELPNLKYVDLIITSTMAYRNKFRSMNLASEYMLPAFDSRVLDRLKNNDKLNPLTFVGGVSSIHKRRWEALNYLVKHTNLQIWGYGISEYNGGIIRKWLGRDIYSSIRKHHHGEIWGLEMYQLLKDSLITFNVHEDLLKGDVGNMRMFEASGVGTALLNDHGNNINELFEPDKEIITYKSLPEAVEKAKYYIANPDKAKEIGLSSQKRTLRDYNYTNYTIQSINYIKAIFE